MRKLKIVFVLSTVVSIHAVAQNNSVNLFQSSDGRGDFRNFSFQTSIIMQRNHFAQKANTVGNQYLFTDWVRGSVVDSKGAKFDGLFNLDKIGQNLYLKLDTSSNNAFMVDKQQVQFVSLSDGSASYEFEKIPSMKNDKLYCTLVKGKYSLYSFAKTKFIASNYSTNGIATSGNLYDEFKDEVSYYVIFPDGTSKEISLKKKSIKSVLEAEKEKIDLFFKSNEFALDENSLKSLIKSLNQ